MYLLDVNVLLAIAYKEHVNHPRATRWIRHVEAKSSEGWLFATCSIVELGFIRVAAGKSKLAENLTVARADLRRLKGVLPLRMLGDDLDGNQLPRWVMKSAQTTDGHLLELATHHHMQFATLDTRIPGAFLIPEDLGTRDEVREPDLPYGEAA
jgi:predicted nucleic acid-binding protein